MTEITFLINENSVNNLTWEEFEAFERAQEGEMKLYRLRPILARFMQNGNGTMPHDKAMKILGEIPINQIKDTIDQFVSVLKGSTIPKASGSPSSLPSDPLSVGSVSPDGSQP